jgi:hypothetical protein
MAVIVFSVNWDKVIHLLFRRFVFEFAIFTHPEYYQDNHG